MAKVKMASSFGLVLFALSMAQFIMTVDTTIMNVSVPTLVNDLNTTVGSVQTAITLYALVMASLMLVGGKLGEIYGRKRMFNIGLVVYAVGSAVTALAPNILVLIFGWSILEGVGASLMMPAMMALISVNFKDKQRVTALGVVAGVVGAAAALGPIFGGALSTYASWRYAFIGEAIIALFTLFLAKNILDTNITEKEKIDYKGSVMAVLGLSIFVIGILQASTYGWLRAIKPFPVGSFEFAPFGISIVPFICGIGLLIMWRFFIYQKSQINHKKPFLLKVGLLGIKPLRSGLSVVLFTQLVLAGSLFVLPLFLQLVLGFTAMESGIALLPISISLIGLSFFGQKLFGHRQNIDNVRLGQALIFVGLIYLLIVISNKTTAADLVIPFLILGAGIGLVIPFIQNIVLGSVKDKDSSQVSGLNYTYQQLGTSLGTAVLGSFLLFSLGNGIVEGLSSSDKFNQELIKQNSVQISSNVEFVSNDQLILAMDSTNLTEGQKNDIIIINTDARIRALRVAVGAAAIFVLLGLGASGRVKDSLDINPQKAETVS